MKNSIYDNRILVVDDNYELRTMLRAFLTKEGYREILMAETCAEAEAAILNQQPDFVILDINLPDGDGFSLMKRIRSLPQAGALPVLFLSARDKDADRLTGLGLGADDYMVKPFLPKELMLRMAAILKRSYSYGAVAEGAATGTATVATAATTSSADAGSVFHGGASLPQHRLLSLGTHTVDFDAGTVSCGAHTDSLTVKELKILETLARDRGCIVTFDNLCKAVWDAQYYTYENTVMVHMRRLREKVEDDPSHPKWIVTARGLGYKLNLRPAVKKAQAKDGQAVETL